MGKIQVFEGVIDGLGAGTFPAGLAINLGLVPGYKCTDKFFINPIVTSASDPEDFIEQGGDIYYPDFGTAPIRYISSSSAADVGQPIIIAGLDIEGKKVQQVAITNGQNLVALDTPLFRQYRMSNESDSLDIQGILYCHADAAAVAGVPDLALTSTIINGNHNQTLFGGFTIGAGKVGILMRGEAGVGLEGNTAALAEYAHVHYESRRLNRLFKVKKAITLIVGGSSSYQDNRTFGDVIPALTDLRLRCIEVSQTMGLWGTLDIIEVDEDKLDPLFLKSIGQPGY